MTAECNVRVSILSPTPPGIRPGVVNIDTLTAQRDNRGKRPKPQKLAEFLPGQGAIDRDGTRPNAHGVSIIVVPIPVAHEQPDPTVHGSLDGEGIQQKPTTL